jgi:hypothetical protein
MSAESKFIAYFEGAPMAESASLNAAKVAAKLLRCDTIRQVEDGKTVKEWMWTTHSGWYIVESPILKEMQT